MTILIFVNSFDQRNSNVLGFDSLSPVFGSMSIRIVLASKDSQNAQPVQGDQHHEWYVYNNYQNCNGHY